METDEKLESQPKGRWPKGKGMTDEEVVTHFQKISAEYRGDLPELSDAMGALMFSRQYGWRVLRIVISTHSYARHQRILGLNFRDVSPETTEFSKKSVGYNLAIKLNSFWAIAKGSMSIDSKKKPLAI